VETPIGVFPARGLLRGEVMVLLRPDSVKLNREGSCQLAGKVAGVSFRGNICKVTINIDEFSLHFDLPTSLALPKIGEQTTISFEPDEAIQLFAEG
jgi:ABC-type Fe3+/spermidine/putrescine transport system ATPase subunit